MTMAHHDYHAAKGAAEDKARPVRVWLYLLAALVFLMVLVGGATRLTDSGLSITEWKPVTGIIPPLTDEDWIGEFANYQQIPEYEQINRGMTLAEFKRIYWWEWVHRFLGRMIGFAFLIPFLWFWRKRSLPAGLGRKLGAIFALGAFQGGVGWWMVKSGLVNRVDVSQYRLAIHLTIACLIFVAIVWLARSLTTERPEPAPYTSRWFANGLIVLVLGQIFLGGLVSGTDAGLTHNTWPLIDGHFIPPLENLFAVKPAWKNFFENVVTVQFDHRMIGYLVVAAAFLHSLMEHRRNSTSQASLRANLFAFVAFLQASLGVTVLVTAVPIGMALVHQAVAMILLTVAVLHRSAMSARN